PDPPPPRAERVETAPDPRWRTFLLYGPRDRQDRLLVEAVAPPVAAPRARKESDAWFFLPYVDGPRPHPRVRARGGPARLARRLERALAPARDAGDLVTSAETPYHPERARYGKALAAVERLFENDSDRAVAAIADGAGDVELVRHLDALAAGLGL